MAAAFTVFLIIAALFKEMAELVNLGSFASDTTYAQMGINAVSAILAVSTLWWWGNSYGVYGVLLALVFTQGVRFLLFYLVSQYLYRLPTRSATSPFAPFSACSGCMWPTMTGRCWKASG